MTNTIKTPVRVTMNHDQALAYAVEIAFNELLKTVNRHDFNLLSIPFEELDGNLKSEFADICAKVLQAVPTMPADAVKAPGQAMCELCHQPMPEGEEMFRYHGYSGPCPAKPSADSTGTP
jgi:hypothetical protein